MLSPQVFNLADMATLKRVSVAGDADPADLKDIVENVRGRARGRCA